MPLKIGDCYYYYYSSCSKGDTCSFRHEPAALGSETMCVNWLKGKCVKPHCNFRHMEIQKNRNKIPCYHETQPGGCKKEHCPFLHGIKQQKSNNFNGGLLSEIPPPLKNNNFNRPMGKNPKQNTPQAKPRQSKRPPGKPSKNVSVTAFELARRLSEFSRFSTTLLVLLEEFHYTPQQVKSIVNDNLNIFRIDGELIYLRPKVDLCSSYLDEGGCASMKSCQDIHICRQFIMGRCPKQDNCLYGHSFTTNHNNAVVNSLKLSLVSVDLLAALFRASIFHDNLKDKLKICVDYNNGKCQKLLCLDLHLCLKELQLMCTSGKCTLNHDFLHDDVLSILEIHGISVTESPRDILNSIKSSPLVKQCISRSVSPKPKPKDTSDVKSNGNSITKTIWTHDIYGEVPIPEICYASVESLCASELTGCQRLHSNVHYHWQVKPSSGKNVLWTNLTQTQSDALEKAYCDPTIEKVQLLPVDPSVIKDSSKDLLYILNGKSKWMTDFKTMQLTLSGSPQVLSLRRLCTETTGKTVPNPCQFLWYFLDKNNVWIEYGHTDSSLDEKVKVNVKSKDIEKQYQQNPKGVMSFQSRSFSYTLNFMTMLQQNVSTAVSRCVRRRPMPHIKDQNTTLSVNLPSHWDNMQPDERVKRIPLLPTSEEYTKLVSLIAQTGGTSYRIKQIERVQNPYFWRAFENKVQEMTHLYKTKTAVNVQQLFHGTNPDIVPKVCQENFDWRLHGSNVGQIFGRGTYFSPLISTAYDYTRPDTTGYRYVFVAKVAVGSITTGNSTMTRPPINPQTNLPFDSTVDKTSTPSKIVKYDKQEYFPEYILTLG